MCSNAYKLFLNFKTALYYSALVMNFLTAAESCLGQNYYSFFQMHRYAFAHSPL